MNCRRSSCDWLPIQRLCNGLLFGLGMMADSSDTGEDDSVDGLMGFESVSGCSCWVRFRWPALLAYGPCSIRRAPTVSPLIQSILPLPSLHGVCKSRPRIYPLSLPRGNSLCGQTQRNRLYESGHSVSCQASTSSMCSNRKLMEIIKEWSRWRMRRPIYALLTDFWTTVRT